jgi:hypothetical protein
MIDRIGTLLEIRCTNSISVGKTCDEAGAQGRPVIANARPIRRTDRKSPQSQDENQDCCTILVFQHESLAFHKTEHAPSFVDH